jgi:hypothetical protein
MHRRILTLLFTFLLLGMQQEMQLHALTHLADWLQVQQERTLQSLESGDAPCAECLLLAGGANAAPADPVQIPQVAGSVESLHAAAASRPADAPSYYSSRAPPASL